MEDTRICQICGEEHPRDSMLFTFDCHGIPFRLVCTECYDKAMRGRGYDGEYYNELDENLDWDY